MTNNRTIALFFLSALVTHVHTAQQSPSVPAPTDIWSAIEADDVAYVQALIDRLPSMDPVERITFQVSTRHGADLDTPLHVALKQNKQAIARLFITNKLFIDTKNQKGVAPVHLAAEYGYATIVRKLIAQGINAYDENMCGDTALHIAVRSGHRNVVQALLGADRTTRTDDLAGAHMFTPAHIAAEHGNTAMMQTLIDEGLETYWCDQFDKTPLHLASSNGHVDVAMLLINHNQSEVHEHDAQDNTPLHLAAKSGHADVTRVLLEAGAQPESNILISAARRGHCAIVQLLLSAGADPDVNDSPTLYKPIEHAARFNHKNMMRLLIARGAKPIQTFPANPQEAQFQTELAQIGHNRRQMFRKILRSKGLPFDLIGYMAQFAPFDIARQ